MLGRSVISALEPNSHRILSPSRLELDLLNKGSVENYFTRSNRIDLVIHCAARVGGIQENISHPFEMISENIQIDSNVINISLANKVPNFLYFGSSCMYPRNHEGLLAESDVLSGKLEPTNEGYALAKIVGAKTIDSISQQFSLNWRTFILSNLYGPGDTFEENKSHLISAIILKIMNAVRHQEETIQMWGDGKAKREFTYVNDIANFVAAKIECLGELPQYMNVGAGVDHSVLEYYEVIKDLLGYSGKIVPDETKPVGMTRKLMDSSLAKEFGWRPNTQLREGIESTLIWLESRGVSDK